jgi:hypothetical protein
MTGAQDYDGSLTGSMKMSEFRTIAPVAGFKIGERAVFGISLNYNYTNLDFSPGDSFDLHSLDAQIKYFWKSAEGDWWALGFATPGLGTDFEGISWDDFQVGALGLVGYRYSETFTIAAGAYAAYANEETVVLPALGFIWTPGDWVFQVTPPFLVVGYRVSDSFTVSMNLYPSGGSWDVDRSDGINTVELSGWQAALSLVWQVNRNLSVGLRGGVNIGGEFEFRDRNNRALVEENLDPAPFGAVNVRWQF